MNMSKKLASGLPLALLALAAGCSSTHTSKDPKAAAAAQALEQRAHQLEQRDAALRSKESNLRELSSQLTQKERQLLATQQAPAAGEGQLLPPNAKPGECYARVWVPPQYRTITDQVVKKEAGEKVEIIPARFETGKEQVLVKEASERIEVIPATYKTVTERVLVRPASTKLIEVPARYETVTERVLDKPEHTVWKKGRGPIQKIDASTGEIMCLVTIPATYKTITKRVLKSPATTKEVEIPAVYKTVKRRVVDRPAATRTIQIPAQYKTVPVRKIAEPAKTRRIEIPAEYATVTRREMTSDGRMEWRSILCETNMTRNRISAIQQALRAKGFNPGPADGVIGAQTMQAVNAFQRANKLPVDKYLNIATVRALGVSTH